MVNLEGKKLKRVINPTIAGACAHELRGHVWVKQFERGETSPTDIATELEIRPDQVYYHFGELERRGLSKFLRMEPGARGIEKHIYAPVMPALDFDDASWMELPVEIRSMFSGEMARQIIEGITSAIAAGSLDARDRHLSQSWVLVDARGWGEMTAVARMALERFLAIGKLAGTRRKKTGEAGIPVCVSMAVFETADSISRCQRGESEAL